MPIKNCGLLLRQCHQQSATRRRLYLASQYGYAGQNVGQKCHFSSSILSRYNNCVRQDVSNSSSVVQYSLGQHPPVDLDKNTQYCSRNINNTTKSRRNINTIGKILRPHVDPKLSYAFGRSAEDLIYSTIDREFFKKVSESPDDVAFAFDAENKLITIGQLNHDVNKLTKALITRFNIGKGDFVGVFAYNCYHWCIIEYACSKLGAILSPINPSYKSHELAYVLKKGKIKCLFMPGPRSVQAELNNHLGVLQSDEIIQMSRAKELRLEHVVLMDPENEYKAAELQEKFKLANCELVDWSTTENDGQIFSSIQEAEASGFRMERDEPIILDPDHHVSPDDLFAVYYTSGTTGRPKGACISHFTVLNNLRFCQLRVRNGRPRNFRAISATTLPMFHIFAGVLNLLGPSVSNTMIVFPSHKYDIAAYVESVLRHRANLSVLTPTMLIDLLSYIETNSITDVPLKLIQPGGSSLPPELVTRAFKVLPNLEELRSGYGSTENGAVATFQTIHEPNETRNLTVGPPIDFTEIRIVGPALPDVDNNNNNDNFRVLPLGEIGEIQTRGHNTMVEYLDEPEKTREVYTSSRWYRTGDIGFLHPHGSVQVSGRMKHMIIKGGENVYPDEVEQIIYKMDCIEEVHVFGVPDKRFGEQVCAWIKLKSNYRVSKSLNSVAQEIHQNDVIKFCRDNITYFKVPKYILFVDEFPMTQTKKVQNHVMIQQTIELLGLEEHVGESKKQQ